MGLVLMAALTGACDRKPASPAPAEGASAGPLELNPRDVTGVMAERLLSGVRVVGTLNPAVTVDLKAQMAEVVEEVLVHRGTVVTQGQVLAHLDDSAPLAELNRIRSQMAAAERDLRAADILFKGGAISERTYSSAQVAVETARAQMSEAQLSFDHATVKSPIDGVVSDRAVSIGESVSPGQRLFSVVNSEYLECVVSVLPTDVVNIREGQRAVLRVAAYGNRELEGLVSRMDPLADPKSRRVRVYIRISNQDRGVVAGLFCTGSILTNAESAERMALFVSSAAVRTEDGKRVVYKVSDGRLQRTPVVLGSGENLEGLVEVHSGVSSNEMLVLSTTQELQDGRAVKLFEGGGRP